MHLIQLSDIEKKAIRFAADRLGISHDVLWAVVLTESSGDPFLPDGRPKILFEGHVFWQELEKRGIDPIKLSFKYPHLIYHKWTKKFYLGGAREYDRLNEAMTIDREAALCSCSWGAFQIMAYHYKKLGYKTVDDFVKAMHEKRGQLEIFVKLIEAEKLAQFLTNIDRSNGVLQWVPFCIRYNGPGYEANKYHFFMQQNYEIALKDGW